MTNYRIGRNISHIAVFRSSAQIVSKSTGYCLFIEWPYYLKILYNFSHKFAWDFLFLEALPRSCFCPLIIFLALSSEDTLLQLSDVSMLIVHVSYACSNSQRYKALLFSLTVCDNLLLAGVFILKMFTFALKILFTKRLPSDVIPRITCLQFSPLFGDVTLTNRHFNWNVCPCIFQACQKSSRVISSRVYMRPLMSSVVLLSTHHLNVYHIM